MNVASDNKVGTSIGYRYDADNTVWVKGTYENDGVAKTPMMVQQNESGYVFLDIADNANWYMFGVPAVAHATGVEGWIQIGGPCDDVITPSLSMTVGHAFGVHDGTIVDKAADFGVNLHCAVARTETTTSTTQDMWLIARPFLAST
jgi:hypothetical protein